MRTSDISMHREFDAHWAALEPTIMATLKKLATSVQSLGQRAPQVQSSEPAIEGWGRDEGEERAHSLVWSRSGTDVAYIEARAGLFVVMQPPAPLPGLRFGCTTEFRIKSIGYEAHLLPNPVTLGADAVTLIEIHRMQCEGLEDMARDIAYRLEHENNPSELTRLGGFYNNRGAYKVVAVMPRSWDSRHSLA